MKIEISEALRFEIDPAIINTSAAAEVLSSMQSSVESYVSERDKEQGKIDELGGLELPNELQVRELMVARERYAIIESTLAKYHAALDTKKTTTLRYIAEANELFRRIAGRPLTDFTREQLIASLPPSVQSNDHLLVSIWSGSTENRALGQFLHTILPTRRDDTETIVTAAQRIVRLLTDLLAGNDITAFAPSSAEAAA